MVPIIQPPVIRALTSREERRIRMPYDGGRTVSRRTRILFHIVMTIIAGLPVPDSVALARLPDRSAK